MFMKIIYHVKHYHSTGFELEECGKFSAMMHTVKCLSTAIVNVKILRTPLDQMKLVDRNYCIINIY